MTNKKRAWEMLRDKDAITVEEFKKLVSETIWRVYICFALNEVGGSREKAAAQKLERVRFETCRALDGIIDAHRALGAPGDWGYETYEGRCLQDLYCLHQFGIRPVPEYDPIAAGA